jgi:hypothetical protein
MPVTGNGTAMSSRLSTAVPRIRRRCFLPATGYLVQTMPGRFLIAACGLGLTVSFVSSQFLSPHSSAAGVLLLSWIATAPVAASAAFLAATPDKILVTTLPGPSWLPHAVHLVAALLVIGPAAAVQFVITRAELAQTAPYAHPGQLSWESWLSQFTAWLMVSTATAATVDRTRWRDLGGALAMPIALALIALLLLAPSHSLWIWWATIAVGASAALWQSRDPWSRIRAQGRRKEGAA